MSEQKPNNNGDLLNFIAGQFETMREQMATKDDIAAMRSEMATKDDLNVVKDEVSFLGGQVELMRGQMATKGEIARLGAKMDAGFAAVRGDIEQTHLRLDSVERVMSSRVDRVETELGRVRSVLYLLVKDRPDMLRLLGHVPGAGGEGLP